MNKRKVNCSSVLALWRNFCCWNISYLSKQFFIRLLTKLQDEFSNRAMNGQSKFYRFSIGLIHNEMTLCCVIYFNTHTMSLAQYSLLYLTSDYVIFENLIHTVIIPFLLSRFSFKKFYKTSEEEKEYHNRKKIESKKKQYLDCDLGNNCQWWDKIKS